MQIGISFFLSLIFAADLFQEGVHAFQICNSTPLGAMVQQFYCTSHSLRKLSKSMVNDYKAVVFAEHNIDAVDQLNISQAINHLSYTCKTFTTAMAIKHQLQYSLFSGTYYFKDNNGIPRRVISDEGFGKMTSALKYIETLTSILQDIERKITNKQCIAFSSDQYKKLYWNLFDAKDISVLNALQSVTWTKPRRYPPEWTNNYRCAPPPRSSCDRSG